MKDQEKQIHKIELSFKKLEDGTCDIFADILSFDNILQLTAEKAKFIQTKLFTQDDPNNILLNIPYEDLKRFAENILFSEKGDNQP